MRHSPRATPQQRTYRVRSWLFAGALLLASTVSAQERELVLGEKASYGAARGLSTLRDAGGQLTVAQVESARFYASRSSSPSFGYTKDAIWLRLRIRNQSDQPDWRLVLGTARLGDVRFYEKTANGQYRETMLGIRFDFFQRGTSSRHFVFNLNLPRNETVTVYLRVASPTSLQLPLRIWRPNAFAEHEREEMLILGTLLGAHILLFIYNLAIGLFARSKPFAYCAALVLAAAFFYSSTYGFSYRYFWPNMPEFNLRVNMAALCFLVISGTAFARSLLETSRWPRIDRTLRVLMALVFLSIVLAVVARYDIAARILIVLAIGSFLPLAVAALLGLRVGHPPAKYFLLAIASYAFGACIFAAVGLGFLPASTLFQYAFLFGATTAATILSLAAGSAVRALAIEREAALAAERFKSRFLSVMSHEIRTPLTAVVGMSDLIASATSDQERAHYVRILQESGQRLEQLVNQVLDYAQIEEGRIVLTENPFDLTDLIHGIVRLLGPSAGAKGLELTVVNALDGRTLCGDSIRISQVLMNLIGNAIKFTESGGITVRISSATIPDAKSQEQSTLINFSIEDTGIGIPAESRQAIFESFVQVESGPARRRGGSGLGLAIVRELVELMNGQIHLEEHPQGGSIFRLSLPLQIVNSASRVEERAAQAATRPLTILVAEDDVNSALLVETVLRRAGHEVVLARNGLDAMIAITRHPVDLVLMDLQMPEMDGLTAARRVRQLKSPLANVRMYALSANALPSDLKDCQLAGFDGHMAKPYRAGDLLDLVRAVSSGEPAVHDFRAP